MFNPDKFRSHFDSHQDFAKASKFEVIIQPPPAAADLQDPGYSRGLSFQCEGAELPGYTINTVDNRIYGVPNPVAFSASFSDITLNFICAGDMWEKQYFDRWVDIIVPINNYNPLYKSQYESPGIVINQYSELVEDLSAAANQTENTVLAEPTQESQKRYSVKLIGAFPVAVAPIPVNWGDDGFLKLAVTFKYEYWTRQAAPNSGSDAIQRPQANPSGSNLQRFVPDRYSPKSTPTTSLVQRSTGFVGGGGKFNGGGASGSW